VTLKADMNLGVCKLQIANIGSNFIGESNSMHKTNHLKKFKKQKEMNLPVPRILFYYFL